ncbi:MAG: acyltransferase, partial [Marmoricola sp.]|nr:acyltransferase [Marmoricola sp.]
MTAVRPDDRVGSGSSPDRRDGRTHAVRPEIQGLRCVAVMLVVLYHLWPGRLRGGYIGVDVFFVISGFLITGNLLRDVDRRGRVSLAQFWARRVRRLLPAAFLVLLVTGLVTLVFVPRLQWQQFFKEIGACTLYIENWSLAHDAVDYLAETNSPSPVQHYWTLSVEEQFYIVWPLLILLGLALATTLRRSRRVPITAVLGAAVAGSLAYSLWFTQSDPQYAYFSTFTRAWEFGAGALLACATRMLLPTKGAAVLGWLGLLGIAVGALVFNGRTPMPGTAAILVVVCSVLVIGAGDPQQRWSPTRLLTWRPATFIGDISYSIYLWHWPLLVLFPYVFNHRAGFTDRVGILVVTVLAAWATKRFVEDPVRTNRTLIARPAGFSILAAAVVAAVIVAGCGTVWWRVEKQTQASEALARNLLDNAPACFGAAARDPHAQGCPNHRLDGTIVPSVTAVADDYPNYPSCDAQMLRRPLEPCEFGAVNDPKVPLAVVIGDSHARALMPALLELAKKRVLSLELFTSGGCAWGDGQPQIATKTLRDSCASMKAEMQPMLERSAKRYAFILTTAWTNKQAQPLSSPGPAMAAAWAPLARRGVPIVAVRDNPSAGGAPQDNPNNCLAKVDVKDANARCSLDRRRTLDRWPDPFAQAVARTKGAHLIDLTRFYCDRTTCPAVIGGVDVYRDNSHITVTYARTLAPYLLRELRRLG